MDVWTNKLTTSNGHAVLGNIFRSRTKQQKSFYINFYGAASLTLSKSITEMHLGRVGADSTAQTIQAKAVL